MKLDELSGGSLSLGAMRSDERPRRGARWLQRRVYRYLPISILIVLAAPIALAVLLDLFVPPVRDELDGLAKSHEVAVSLIEHLLVAALVAAFAFYWVLGRKRQMAFDSYRESAHAQPWRLVDWSQRKAPTTRRTTSERIAEWFERSPQPAVAVVRGRPGTGRTGFIVGLVRDLAACGLLPIPIRARRDGSLAFEDDAREKFCEWIDPRLSSRQEVDEIWHRARSTRDVVILVDGLDEEFVKTLDHDGGGHFQDKLEDLRSRHIGVVLATTGGLPLGDVRPLREDLDLFNRDEAEQYLEAELKDMSPTTALEALGRLPDSVDGALLSPYFLELLVKLDQVGRVPSEIPEHRDGWRCSILRAYLQAIKDGQITSAGMGSEQDPAEVRSRGAAAVEIAEEVAHAISLHPTDFTVALTRIEPRTETALDDAVDLELLGQGAEHVGVAHDDLGSYLLAATTDDPDPLLGDVGRIAGGDRVWRRRDRHTLSTLCFWHLQHEGEGRRALFERFLAELERKGWTRPAVVAGLVRIASASRLTGRGVRAYNARVAGAVHRCINALEATTTVRGSPDFAPELIGLVRALAEWPSRTAHPLLWRLATNPRTGVEWPAAKALALAGDEPEKTLRQVIGDTLRRAETATPAELSVPAHVVGAEVASLAWILPALRASGEIAEAELDRVIKLCLNREMSPLRGEMALARGLKFAIVNDRAGAQNMQTARELLAGRGGGLRFWHARLALIQAMFAHAWLHPERAEQCDRQLELLKQNESHRLVRRGIELARRGLRQSRASSNGSYARNSYMWTDEREVVRWVEQGRTEIGQLAADAILLSNMIYRLRAIDRQKADSVAGDAGLPACIRKSSDRKKIVANDCSCRHGLCVSPGSLDADPAVLFTRARFSESFCREQAGLAMCRRPPPWVARRVPSYWAKRRLEDFWIGQAEVVQENDAARERGSNRSPGPVIGGLDR